MLDLFAATLLATGGASSVPADGCPQGVLEQLNGLYAWQVARQDAPGRGDLVAQRPRFTAALFDQLKQAWDLDPRTDGAYLGFDVFSGTQMATYGAQVRRCQTLTPHQIDAEVAVAWGRGGQPAPTPSLLEYRMVRENDRWRISEITYRSAEEPYTLSSSLTNILQAASRSSP